MQAIAIISPSGFEAALTAAREVDAVDVGGGLAAPLGAGLLGKIQKVWDQVETVLNRAYQFGVETARASLDGALKAADELLASVGHQAHTVHAALMEHIEKYLSSLIDHALTTIRSTVSIGPRTLQLEGVDLAQTISLSGSLKVALTDIVNLTATGEIVVTARYGPERIQ